MIKVAILGPESTGKTALAKRLAEHFNTPWIPEYAREYVEKLTIPYTYDDVCNIARTQIEQEKLYEEHPELSNSYVFFDTDLIITKVWLEYKYGVVPEFITERLKTGFYDLYLLCTPDLPWEADPVREHEADREFFFNWYKKEIEQTGKPCVIVTGTGNQRVLNALAALPIIFVSPLR
jgi:NadR type nicotinamide-nucleotide adenylyltransferase